MRRIRKKAILRTHLIKSLLLVLIFLTACQKEFQDRPTPIPSLTPTITQIPTITLTPTLVPTITRTPTRTPTRTATTIPSPTPRDTATPIVYQPANLFELRAGNNNLVDWGYTYITERDEKETGEINQLSALLAFRLLDRGIHSESLTFLEKDITLYYLNVSHDFDDLSCQMRLVIGAAYGRDVPIFELPADGSAYLTVYRSTSRMVFEPWNIHANYLLPFEARQEMFSYMFMQDFETWLSTLPDDLILLAEHPILWHQDSWPQVKFDMSRISATAARNYSLFNIDVYDRLTGPSAAALSLSAHILDRAKLSTCVDAFAARYLVFITK